MDRDYFTNAGMPFPWSSAQNCTSDQSNFFDPNSQFDSSSLTSMVPSSTSDAFILRELIGKLGGGGGAAFPPATHTNNSPPPVPSLPSLSSDPGFAERAAKFSCFGSRSFNGRASPFGGGDHQQGLRSGNPPMANEKLPRVSSSPSLRSQVETGSALLSDKKLPSRLSGSGADSNEESSVSEQIVETGSKNSNELNSRKRKVVSRGKTKEEKSSPVGGVVREEENGNAKRAKQDEAETEKQKTDQKPPEPPKDYIHVRARRGQATDSHSLAERVRREKISERMKLLQDLVPGCNKVTGKALMLDEIINYVQSLQRQVEFLSMKLSSVNPGLDINMENLLSKDVFEQNTTTVAQQMYPIDSSSAPAAIFYHHHQQHDVVQNDDDDDNTNNINIPSLDHLGLHLPSSLHGFNPQFAAFSEDDLQSIVQMGFANFQVPNHTSNMKIER